MNDDQSWSWVRLPKVGVGSELGDDDDFDDDDDDDDDEGFYLGVPVK